MIEENVADLGHEKETAEQKEIGGKEVAVEIVREGDRDPEKEVAKEEIEMIDHRKTVIRIDGQILIEKIEIVSLEVAGEKTNYQLKRQINYELPWASLH